MKQIKRLFAIILTLIGIVSFTPVFILFLLMYVIIGKKAFEIMVIPMFLIFNPLY